MANPGPYPPMGGPMHPMGPPPGGPMAPMGVPRPPVRQGTSHIVPIVVAAGLAVGVFCGLLFGLGVKHQAPEPVKASNGAKQSEESQIQTAAVSMGTKTPARAGSAAAAATGAGSSAASAAPAAGSGGGSGAGSAAAETKPGKISIDIEPESMAAAAKILVDGKPVTGKTAEVAFEPGVTKKSVKVVVRVPGARDIEKSIDVESDAVSSISFDLKGVRPAPASGGAASGEGGGPATAGGGTSGGGTSGGGGAKSNPSKGGGKGSGKGSAKGSGLIDI